MPAAAIVSSECSSWSNWYSFRGQRKVWLARISEAEHQHAAAEAEDAEARNHEDFQAADTAMPATNNETASQSAVPPR